MTLLGIVFVFALAASRGWIGPAVRCTIGGGVSVSLVGASLIIRRRFGHVVAALAAAGAGIGGSYVTLYAASRGYHLLGARRRLGRGRRRGGCRGLARARLEDAASGGARPR